MFKPSPSSFVVQTRGKKSVRPSGVVGDKKKEEKRRGKREKEEREGEGNRISSLFPYVAVKNHQENTLVFNIFQGESLRFYVLIL